MSTRFYVIRHAEHITPTDTHLSPLGSLQAAALGEHFKNLKKKFFGIYTSPRTLETAEKIANLLEMSVTVDSKLQNFDLGDYKGLSKDEIQNKDPAGYAQRYIERNPEYHLTPNSETLQQRIDRVKSFIESVAETGPSVSPEPREVIVVTHGGIIDDLFRLAVNQPVSEKPNLAKPWGCLSVLLYENGKWRDEEWARADHLPKIVALSPGGGHLFMFPNQVSGSFPMLRGDRGEICKPATQNELSVYNYLFSSGPISDELLELRKNIPQFLGTVDIDIDALAERTNSEGSNLGLSPKKSSTLDNPDSYIENEHNEESVAPTTTPSGIGHMSNVWRRFIADRWKKMVPSKVSNGTKSCIYLILQDASFNMSDPNILDAKIGTRQHRDSEALEKQKRKEERCATSTSSTLGFRLHGISMFSKQENRMVRLNKYWGRNATETEILERFKQFVDVQDRKAVVEQIVGRLTEIIKAVEKVNWRFYGSSILIVHDPKQKEASVNVRLIDFGSCDMNEHNSYSDYDKGCVFGLRSLCEAFEKLLPIEPTVE